MITTAARSDAGSIARGPKRLAVRVFLGTSFFCILYVYVVSFPRSFWIEVVESWTVYILVNGGLMFLVLQNGPPFFR